MQEGGKSFQQTNARGADGLGQLGKQGTRSSVREPNHPLLAQTSGEQALQLYGGYVTSLGAGSETKNACLTEVL